MFGNSGPTLGYASAAVLVCLMKKLISDGTITKERRRKFSICCGISQRERRRCLHRGRY
jgi:hypothetical protein